MTGLWFKPDPETQALFRRVLLEQSRPDYVALRSMDNGQAKVVASFVDEETRDRAIECVNLLSYLPRPTESIRRLNEERIQLSEALRWYQGLAASMKANFEAQTLDSVASVIETLTIDGGQRATAALGGA